ncbi:polysaccharide deacetylase family protein [Ruegeria sp. R14_0]|uniref:polysaccharide deacetylase family protein n=1 Tax=Ruegeria sp. R14_0 TaxID=2821100 RepID=UPI001ADAD81B|nr:polysaccharide deacetylase family protein [Ruegeria sp. R14_0]MBO9444210.1 polysaccharide deacetylase family protein [Ruegeria sp. R14_0]
MMADWNVLTDELALWQQQGLILPLWWRDDDAVSKTPQLERLSAMSEDLGVPVHLAIIPREAEDSLADYVNARSHLIPVVHGWAHQNHAPQGEKKSEFRLHRPMADIQSDAQAGMSRLQALFGNRLCPMFVPPWNRIAPEVAPELPKAGYRILSTATPRSSAQAAPGLDQINTHLDPIDWRGSRGLANPDTLIAKTVHLLKDRREGRADNAEPFGVLTHHLVHDEDIWTFTHDLLLRLLDGPSVIWSAPTAE